MRWLLDLIYLTVAILTAPIWMVRMIRTGKIRTDWRGRFGGGATLLLPPKQRRRVLIHAVSVGEVNAIRALVDVLAARSDGPEIVIATTTDTGYQRAVNLWRGRFAIVRYPFDFSFAVRRFLRAIDPDVVALIELEVWPNFVAECAQRGRPVCVINGRLSARSHHRYRKIGRLLRSTFGSLAQVGAQDEDYASRFRSMGVPAERVQVTGTMKWDSAVISDTVLGSNELAVAMGIDRSRPLIVAGSTAPDEHKLLAAATPAQAQLLCAPRKPEWFDQAAEALPDCVRRSRGPSYNNGSVDRYLLDTIGELRQAYALADVVVIGRSFGDLHGSDMIEPIALGKPTVVGPAVSDFQESMNALLKGDGVIQTTRQALPSVLAELLGNPTKRRQLADNGRAVIRANQGATNRSVEIILACLQPTHTQPSKTNPPSRR